MFNLKLTDFDPAYVAFWETGFEGGSYSAKLQTRQGEGSTPEAVRFGASDIRKDISSFQSGRQFHFLEPSGNVLIVRTDIQA